MFIEEKMIIKCANVDESCGTKAESLSQLCGCGVNVPEFVVIPSGFVDEYCSMHDVVSVRNFYKKSYYDSHIYNMIDGLPDPILTLNVLEDGEYMVRSSSIPSKGISKHDFSSIVSGAFDSYLAKSISEIPLCLKKVLKSAYSEKAFFQCKMLSNEGLIIEGLGIVIQKAINPICSGVIHTDDKRITINWVDGHLSKIVSGMDRGNICDMYKTYDDHYILRGKEMDVMKVVNGGFKHVFCSLFDISVIIMNHLGSCQEIEWLYDGNQIWIVQSQDWLKV